MLQSNHRSSRSCQAHGFYMGITMQTNSFHITSTEASSSPHPYTLPRPWRRCRARGCSRAMAAAWIGRARSTLECYGLVPCSMKDIFPVNPHPSPRRTVPPQPPPTSPCSPLQPGHYLPASIGEPLHTLIIVKTPSAESHSRNHLL
jgi:hypothetical protein